MRTFCLLLALAGAPALAAQGTTAAPANPSAGTLAGSASADTAALVIGNEAVLVFRSKVGLIVPEQRLEMARERIGLAARPGPDSVQVFTDSLGAMILLNGAPVFIVTRGRPAAGQRRWPRHAVRAPGWPPEPAGRGWGPPRRPGSVRALAIGAASVSGGDAAAPLRAPGAGPGAGAGWDGARPPRETARPDGQRRAGSLSAVGLRRVVLLSLRLA